jgi:hypothetical protein
MNAITDADPSLSESRPARRGLNLLLPDHHRHLEAKCRELLGWAYTDDPRQLAAAWCELEAEIHDHLAAEEQVMLPCYAEHAPSDARRILDDHARIRELLTPMGIEIELHATRATRLRHLADALDAHALFEDATMYPWAESNVTAIARRLLFVRVGRWFGGA